jgi:hypothetical protein
MSSEGMGKCKLSLPSKADLPVEGALPRAWGEQVSIAVRMLHCSVVCKLWHTSLAMHEKTLLLHIALVQLHWVIP